MAGGDERGRGRSGTWDPFWYGMGLGFLVGLWRYPREMCCCVVLIGIVLVVVGIAVAALLWSYWPVLVLLVLLFYLYRRVVLPWLRERLKEP